MQGAHYQQGMQPQQGQQMFMAPNGPRYDDEWRHAWYAGVMSPRSRWCSSSAWFVGAVPQGQPVPMGGYTQPRSRSGSTVSAPGGEGGAGAAASDEAPPAPAVPPKPKKQFKIVLKGGETLDHEKEVKERKEREAKEKKERDEIAAKEAARLAEERQNATGEQAVDAIAAGVGQMDLAATPQATAPDSDGEPSIPPPSYEPAAAAGSNSTSSGGKSEPNVPPPSYRSSQVDAAQASRDERQWELPEPPALQFSSHTPTLHPTLTPNHPGRGWWWWTA